MVRSVFFLLLFSIFHGTGQLAAQVPLPAETVDAFLLAIERADSAALTGLVARTARVYEYDLTHDQFRPMVWAQYPVEYLRFMIGFGTSRIDIEVLDRVVSAGLVSQRERYRVAWGDDIRAWNTLTTYRTRDALIQAVWMYPSEPDSSAVPYVSEPLYEPEQGPQLAIDGGHLNLHKADGGFWSLAELARRDGFRVRTTDERFSPRLLEQIDILVIGNASAGEDDGAFLEEEIRAIREWVERGGRLLLVSDHPPYSGASAALAGAFGIEIIDGRVNKRPKRLPDLFVREDGSLGPHPLLDGLHGASRVDSVGTFTGHAFRADGASSLLTLRGEWFAVMQDQEAKARPLEWWLQAATMQVGSGRLAYFAEARILVNLRVLHNGRLALNLLRWLAEGF